MKRILAAALLAAVPSAALAEAPACGPRADVLKQLALRYSETPIAVGLANNGGLIEILASDTGSTWTIIITTPTGISCMIAAGEDWTPRAATPVGDPV